MLPDIGADEYAGAGAAERPPSTVSPAYGTTIVHGVLFLPGSFLDVPPSSLLDASGRRVLDLSPGANDVSRLSPGVYFVRAGAAGPLRRVVLVR